MPRGGAEGRQVPALQEEEESAWAANQQRSSVLVLSQVCEEQVPRQDTASYSFVQVQ